MILRSSQATNGEEMVSDRFDGKVWLPDPTWSPGQRNFRYYLNHSREHERLCLWDEAEGGYGCINASSVGRVSISLALRFIWVLILLMQQVCDACKKHQEEWRQPPWLLRSGAGSVRQEGFKTIHGVWSLGRAVHPWAWGRRCAWARAPTSPAALRGPEAPSGGRTSALSFSSAPTHTCALGQITSFVSPWAFLSVTWGINYRPFLGKHFETVPWKVLAVPVIINITSSPSQASPGLARKKWATSCCYLTRWASQPALIWPWWPGAPGEAQPVAAGPGSLSSGQRWALWTQLWGLP